MDRVAFNIEPLLFHPRNGSDERLRLRYRVRQRVPPHGHVSVLLIDADDLAQLSVCDLELAVRVRSDVQVLDADDATPYLQLQHV